VETLKDDVETMITTGQEPDITIDSGRVSCTVKKFSIVNSHGLSHAYTATHLSVHFVCRCLQSESTWGVHSSRQYDADFAALAEKTVEQARAISNPQPLNSFTGEAVLLAEPVEDIIATPLRWCFNAETAEKTKFQYKFNEKVASSAVTMADDGTISKGIHTSPVDGEGNPTRRTPLIKKGVLCGLLHSEYTAHIHGIQSTGNAVRRASTEPQVGITNLCIKGGTSTTEELIQDVKKGVLIGDFSGNTDPFTGLFSGVIEHSFSIEKGELTHPVTGVMIHGNIFDLLQNVVDMGQEKRTGEGGIYAVPILVRNLDIISF
jgi:PmbA protein